MNRKEEILGLVRHALTFVGGYAVNADLVANTEAESVVAALITLLGIGWSIVEKVKTRAKIAGLTAQG